MSKVLKFAQRRLKEESHEHELGADNQYVINYWAAYIDGVKEALKEIADSDPTYKMTEETAKFLIACSEYGKQMSKLGNEIAQMRAELYQEDEDVN